MSSFRIEKEGGTRGLMKNVQVRQAKKSMRKREEYAVHKRLAIMGFLGDFATEVSILLMSLPADPVPG